MIKTIKPLLDSGEKILSSNSDTPRLDVELLLCHVLKKNRSYLHTWPDHEVPQQQYILYEKLLNRRIEGEPIAHILGERGFWSLNLKVTPDTLIPRPDTERLVELALDIIPKNVQWKILDLGTGTGAIALSIAKERPHCHIVATDQSLTALDVAKHNASINEISNIEFIHSDWFKQLGESQFDMIVSNPPYICDNDLHLKEGDVRFEPLSALTSGSDGLNDIRDIVSISPRHMNKHGVLLIEHGYDQADSVCDLLKAEGFIKVIDVNDDNDNPRVAIGYIK